VKVFISSTSEDLADHRAVARQVAVEMQWLPIMMEHFGAATQPTVAYCCDRIGEADLVVLLVAFRRGWVPTLEQGGDGVRSITAIELAEARRHRKDVLIFLAKDTWPGNLWDRHPDAQQWIDTFRGAIGQPVGFFEREEDPRLPLFRNTLKSSFIDYRQQRIDVRPPPPPDQDFPRARELLQSGSGVIFIGDAVYGDEPLGRRALAGALATDFNATPDCVVTAAECYQHFLLSRDGFLARFGDVIDDAAARTAPPRLYHLIAEHTARLLETSLRKPLLLVSATWDDLLESALAQAGVQPVVITHVIRSEAGLNDGKILVQNSDGSASLLAADQIVLPARACVLYKLLGSPSLNQRHDALDVDTVVATEEDHWTFLRRLEHDGTSIPTSIRVSMQRRPLLFLGYSLDAWHYRLMTQVLRTADRPGSVAALAVRVPSSPVEKVAWQSLGATMVHLEIRRFVEMLEQGGVP